MITELKPITESLKGKDVHRIPLSPGRSATPNSLLRRGSEPLILERVAP